MSGIATKYKINSRCSNWPNRLEDLVPQRLSKEINLGTDDQQHYFLPSLLLETLLEFLPILGKALQLQGILVMRIASRT